MTVEIERKFVPQEPPRMPGSRSTRLRQGYLAEQAARAFVPPVWFGREVTGADEWTNAALARHGRPR